MQLSHGVHPFACIYTQMTRRRKRPFHLLSARTTPFFSHSLSPAQEDLWWVQESRKVSLAPPPPAAEGPWSGWCQRDNGRLANKCCQAQGLMTSPRHSPCKQETQTTSASWEQPYSLHSTSHKEQQPTKAMKEPSHKS